MTRQLVVCFFATVFFAAGACSKEKAENSAPAAAANASANVAAAHAPKGVKPGSYEDWCGEHQVPESQCTLCHPDLIAAFKATGDWCEEHSLPESHCLKCNPDLKIVRGPKAN
jgi:cytochrome c5